MRKTRSSGFACERQPGMAARGAWIGSPSLRGREALSPISDERSDRGRQRLGAGAKVAEVALPGGRGEHDAKDAQARKASRIHHQHAGRRARPRAAPPRAARGPRCTAAGAVSGEAGQLASGDGLRLGAKVAPGAGLIVRVMPISRPNRGSVVGRAGDRPEKRVGLGNPVYDDASQMTYLREPWSCACD